MSPPPAVTVLVPTWNAGREFPEVLRRMRGQRLDRGFEILVIDSGSTDGTAEFLRRQPDLRLIEIPNAAFDHGLTRNLGIQEARGEIVALAAQDALPADERWLQALVDCFADPRVAGAYSRQLPRPDANPFFRDRLVGWTAAAAAAPRVQSVGSRAEFDALPPLEKLARVTFDNVSASVRRRVALEIPFRACRFGEDLDWARRVLLAGYTIVYEPRSRVVHSHDKSLWYEFKRAYLDHQNRRRLLGVHAIPRARDLLGCTVGETRYLLRIVGSDPGLELRGRVRWWGRALPYAFTQNLAQFLGARSVAKLAAGSRLYRRLDHLLARGV